MSDSTASTAPTRFRIAALQPELRFSNVMPNLHLIRQTVDRLVGEAPLDLVVLPEIFDGRPDATDGAEARQFLATLARACDVNVIGGSCLVADADGKQYNRCHVFRRGGEQVGAYDKRVLFSSEATVRAAGSAPGVYEFDSVRVGVLICADMWHPETARELFDRVDILAVPIKSGLPIESQRKYARAIWYAMALTRAMENGFVVAVADWPAARHDWQREGTGRHTHFTSGAATIVDPSHRPDIDKIQRVLQSGRCGVLRAEIDLQALEAYRSYRRGVGLLPTSPDGT